MKKLLIISILFFAKPSFCQTYDTTITFVKCAKITAIRPTFLNGVNATRLGIYLTNDDMLNQANINYILLDSLGSSLYSGNATISGANYQSWNRSVNQLFNYVAAKLGITLK